MSSNKEIIPSPSLMEQVEHLEVLIHNMKNMNAADNDTLHVASTILAKHQEISNYLDCMKDSAEKESKGSESSPLPQGMGPGRRGSMRGKIHERHTKCTQEYRYDAG